MGMEVSIGKEEKGPKEVLILLCFIFFLIKEKRDKVSVTNFEWWVTVLVNLFFVIFYVIAISKNKYYLE